MDIAVEDDFNVVGVGKEDKQVCSQPDSDDVTELFGEFQSELDQFWNRDAD